MCGEGYHSSGDSNSHSSLLNSEISAGRIKEHDSAFSGKETGAVFAAAQVT